MSIISNTITKSSFSLDVATRNPCLISMLERLLEYFLSTQRHQFNCCDVQWLLEIANELQLENVSIYVVNLPYNFTLAIRVSEFSYCKYCILASACKQQQQKLMIIITH